MFETLKWRLQAWIVILGQLAAAILVMSWFFREATMPEGIFVAGVCLAGAIKVYRHCLESTLRVQTRAKVVVQKVEPETSTITISKLPAHIRPGDYLTLVRNDDEAQ